MRKTVAAVLVAGVLAGCGVTGAARQATTAPTIAPDDRPGVAGRVAGALHLRRKQPAMQWGEGRDDWTAAMIEALNEDGVPLLSAMPADVLQYCPGYATQTRENRAAFWAGFISAVAKYESGWNPGVRGEGGVKGLMQISDGAARAHGCGGSMLNPRANLQCAVRVMTRSITADGAIHGGKRGWRGVARDWMPLRSASTRSSIAAWTSRQSYCR